MSKVVKFIRVGAIALTAATVLTACGGGGGTAAIPVTPTTQTPVASGVAGDIKTAVTIPSGSSTLALAQTNQNTNVSNASASNGSLTSVLNRLASFFIKPAYAQTSKRCVTDALKLVGIQTDGTMSEIPVVEGSDVCDVGFREMFDAGNYVLLTGEGLYKGDLTCNLVFLQKASGKLFCVGESVPSRYIINTASTTGSSSSTTTGAGAMTTGGQTSPAAQKIQVVKNSSDSTVTDYMLIAAESMSFDTNGQINGKTIKLLRFNLKDLEVGPTVQLLAEGLEQNWMQQSNSNETLSFNLENYKIARNGDVFAIYSYYLWTKNPWSSTQRRNVTFFTYNSSDVVTKKSVLASDIQAIVDAQTLANQSLASGYTTGYSASYWYSIPCMFDDPDSLNGVLFTVPYSKWENTYTTAGAFASSQWTQSSYLIKASGTGNASNATITGIKPTQLCADTSGWNGNAPVRIVHPTTGKDVWFSMQRAYVNGYDATGGWYSGSVTTLVGNDLSGTTADYSLVVKKPTLSGSSYSYSNDYSEWQKSRSVLSSKDNLFILTRTASYGNSSTDGNTIFKVQPFDTDGSFRLGSVQTPRAANLDMEESSPQTGRYVLAASASVWVTSLATSLKDNIVNLVGRDLISDSFDKVIGTIDESGNFDKSTITNNKYTALTIVRL
jgi:hypothetical protein